MSFWGVITQVITGRGPLAEWGFPYPQLDAWMPWGKTWQPSHDTVPNPTTRSKIHPSPTTRPRLSGNYDLIKVSGSHINLTSKKTVTFQIWSWYPKQPFFQGCVLNWMMKQIFKMGSWMMNHISTGERRISEPSTVINTAWFSPKKQNALKSPSRWLGELMIPGSVLVGS